MYSRIAGTGSYLPEKILTNAELEAMVDTSDEWIRTRTGIQERHVAADGETTTDLAEHAARRAIDAAGVEASDIDLICVGTTTPDLVFPNVGTLLQDRLGIHGCPAFSLEAACTGFMYALSVADKFVRLGEAKCALVVGAETLTRIVDWNDRGTCVLFADGAGAVVLTPSNEPGIISTRLHSDGRYKDLLLYPDGVSKGFKLVREGKAGVIMKGNEVYKVAVNTLGQLVLETLNANGMSKGRTRLADTASGKHPYHRSDCETARVAHGEGHRHHPWTMATRRPLQCPWRSIPESVTAACSADSYSCWRRLAVASRGAPRSSGTETVMAGA